ncbi:MAG: hypothetical protein R3247_09890 [Rhodothermales bacterium]|nr:hypothetical protein [Rhodothermales bacterium]
MPSLLAVDLGLRTGLACYGCDGRLRWYRSQNFGTAARLKRGAYSLLREADDLEWLVLEGGGRLAQLWEREGARRGLRVRTVDARHWREDLLLRREQRGSGRAKEAAGALARRVIEWAGAPRPTSLRHDAAEAILLGLWAVVEVGWLEALPEALRR